MLYYGSKISDNISKREPEGYLYCLNVPIARTGEYEYLGNEIGIDGLDPREMHKVHRLAEDVFSQAAIASFEGMPITRDHPSEEVTARNLTAYHKGHAQNVRRGGGEFEGCLMADLVVMDADLANDVLHNGLREVSCGYQVDYVQGEDGKIYQKGIVGNHIAIVDKGRAGDRISIRDAEPDKPRKQYKKGGKSEVSREKKVSAFARFFTSYARDESVSNEELATVVDELLEEQEEVKDENPMTGNAENAPDVGEVVKDVDVIELIKELAAEVKALKELVLGGQQQTDEEDPLEELEKEVAGDPVSNEESVTVDPEEIEVDEFMDEEKEDDEEASEGVKKAVISAISELKPIVAGLPVADRKKAADAMAKAVRKAAGLSEKASAKDRQNLAQASAKRVKKRSKDSANVNDGAELGKRIMKMHNPHYKG